MKKWVIIFVTFTLLASCDKTEQQKTKANEIVAKEDTINPNSDNSTPEEAIARIKELYSQTNADQLTSTTSKWNGEKVDQEKCPNPEGEGDVIYYKNSQNEIKKIVSKSFVGDGSDLEEYYFDQGKLYFIFKKVEYTTADETEYIYENRYYIHNDKIIDQKFNSVKGNIENKSNEESNTYLIPKAYAIFKNTDAKKLVQIIYCNEFN